jgi:hypothetical protein
MKKRIALALIVPVVVLLIVASLGMRGDAQSVHPCQTAWPTVICWHVPTEAMTWIVFIPFIEVKDE